MIIYGEPSLGYEIVVLITAVIFLSVFIGVEIKNWWENRK